MTATMSIGAPWNIWDLISPDTKIILGRERRDVLHKAFIWEGVYCTNVELMKITPKLLRGEVCTYDPELLRAAILAKPFVEGVHSPIISVNMEDWSIGHMSWHAADDAERAYAFLRHSWHACHAMLAGLEAERPVTLWSVAKCRREEPFDPWPVCVDAGNMGSAISVDVYQRYGQTPETGWVQAQAAMARDMAHGRPVECWVRHTGFKDRVLIPEEAQTYMVRDVVLANPGVEMVLFFDGFVPGDDDELLNALRPIRNGIALAERTTTEGGEG